MCVYKCWKIFVDCETIFQVTVKPYDCVLISAINISAIP